MARLATAGSRLTAALMGWGRLLAAGGLLVLAAVPAVTAAEVRPGGGLVISPAFQEATLWADQSRMQYTLQLTNRSAADQLFRLSVVDFGALDESGGVAFLGAPASELEHRYGLASWMKLEKDAVVVTAGQTAMVLVTVENRPSLAPGGHYGAVLATAVTENTASGGARDPRVGVRQVLSSLVLAVKDGGGERKLALRSQTTDANWWRLPSRAEHRFQNAGNVHLTPRGVTEVRDGWGQLVARGALNDGSKVILPESFRRYVTPLESVAPAWLPGRYTVTTKYRYDGTDTTQSLTTAVWYVGKLVVWFVVLVAVAAVAGLAWWLWGRQRRRT